MTPKNQMQKSLPGCPPGMFRGSPHVFSRLIGSSELRAWQGRGQEAYRVGKGQAVAADVKAAGKLFRAY